MNETVTTDRGLVVAPHRAAAEAGARILAEGGNAIEAMVATAATASVVYPHMTGIGGDGFWLIAEEGREPRFIDAAGRAGSLATLESYRARGHDEMPKRGAEAAATVPGTVSGWTLALEASRALGGRMPRQDLLADAIERARRGVPVSRALRLRMERQIEALRAVPGFAEHFLADGKLPDLGAPLVQPRLADTLDQLAHAGFEDFYRGDVGAEIAADLERHGAPVRRGDLARQEARLRKPLTLQLDGVKLWNAPAPTQGIAALVMLGLFARLGVKRGEGFDHMHGLIEATKRAYRIRDSEVADPDVAGPLDPYLEDAWLDAEAEKIDRARAAGSGHGAAAGDTVWLGVIDRNGLAVSMIQSLYAEFGCGLVLPRTGIVWNNRSRGFSLDPRRRNALHPGRQPFHTLIPAMARFDDGRTMVYGTMGGDGQPQTQALVFTRYHDFGMEPGAALDAPRFRSGLPTPGAEHDLVMESRFDPDLVRALERAGHRIKVLDEAYEDQMGHAGLIVRDRRGRLSGAADPRSDGAAAEP